ncbi:MAG: glycosyltransferase [Verrucomicrobia bacterium]|nr:MAG: glycosyltransferase [Verrucomicrobiota bacterium]
MPPSSSQLHSGATCNRPNQLSVGVSVVIPVFNSAVILPKLVARLGEVLEATEEPYELILVNDSSPCHCWEIIKEIVSQHPWVRGICMMRNYGQHNALLCGIRTAIYDKLLTMDDDLQHRPEQIPVLLATLKDGNDVVYGIPENEENGLFRVIANRITKLALCSVIGIKIAKDVSAFRALRTQLRDAFVEYQTPFVSIDGLLAWATTRFASRVVSFDKRHAGVSNYTFRKLVRHAFDMMTGFSTFPLQVASVMGFVLAIFGVGVLFYILGRYFLSGSSIPGFPFLASIIALFSGTQLFALGVIGEYLVRIHFRSMKQPAYVIREMIHQPPDSKDRISSMPDYSE